MLVWTVAAHRLAVRALTRDSPATPHRQPGLECGPPGGGDLRPGTAHRALGHPRSRQACTATGAAHPGARRAAAAGQFVAAFVLGHPARDPVGLLRQRPAQALRPHGAAGAHRLGDRDLRLVLRALNRRREEDLFLDYGTGLVAGMQMGLAAPVAVRLSGEAFLAAPNVPRRLAAWPRGAGLDGRTLPRIGWTALTPARVARPLAAAWTQLAVLTRPSTPAVDRYGRRRGCLLALVVAGAGAVLVASAPGRPGVAGRPGRGGVRRPGR